MRIPAPNIETIQLDFGVLGEIDCEVKFHYSPAERQTRDEPGCDAEYDIISIHAQLYDSENNVTDYLPLDGYDIDEKLIIEKLEYMRDVYNDDY